MKKSPLVADRPQTSVAPRRIIVDTAKLVGFSTFVDGNGRPVKTGGKAVGNKAMGFRLKLKAI